MGAEHILYGSKRGLLRLKGLSGCMSRGGQHKERMERGLAKIKDV